MKTVTGYYASCDLIGCNHGIDYFPGEESKVEKQGWVFVYPDVPKNEFDCWTLCPQHAHVAPLFKSVPREDT